MNWRVVNSALMIAAGLSTLILATNVDGYAISPALRFWLTVVAGSGTLSGFLPSPVGARRRTRVVEPITHV